MILADAQEVDEVTNNPAFAFSRRNLNALKQAVQVLLMSGEPPTKELAAAACGRLTAGKIALRSDADRSKKLGL